MSLHPPSLSHGRTRDIVDEMRKDHDELVRAIEATGATVRGTACTCPHPDHVDRNASAGVFQSDDAWRVKCHGCGWCGDVFDVLSFIAGTSSGEEMKRARKGDAPAPQPRTTRRPDDAPSYASEQDALDAVRDQLRRSHGSETRLDRVHRYNDTQAVARFTFPGDKTFRPVMKNCTAWYAKKLNPWPLYRDADLIGTGVSFIFFTEGEKDADNLLEAGLVATTIAGGAKGIPGNLREADLATLHHRDVVLLPDNDDPGRECMDRVAEVLEPVAASVRFLELPDLPDGGDVSDWLDAGNEPEDLVRLAESAPEARHSTETATAQPKNETPEKAAQGDTGQAGSKPSNRLIIRRASDIETKPIEWFYDQRIPAHSLSLIIGMPNTGKSTVTMDIAARVTNGSPWPVGGGNAPRGSVLILSAEDQPEHIIVPRLNAAGADLNKAIIVEGIQHVEDSDGKATRTSVDVGRDAALLEQYIDQLGDVKLIIIDPLDSYIGSQTDIFRGNEARAALEPLKTLAEQRGVTVLICHHFNKAPTTNALDRVSGARSFGALPRSVWIAAADESDREANRSVLAPAKWNMSRNRPAAIGYSMKPCPANPEVAVVEWETTELDVTAHELMDDLSGERESDSMREAKEFIVSMLALGEMQAKELKERAKEAGVSPKTLDAAARKLKVRRVDVRDADGKVQHWVWKMPQ